jgi:glycosyltransferase involved in cell wall biosynthesis
MKGKKRRLLHVISGLKIGGAETVLFHLIRLLGNNDFEHHVIYFHHGPNVSAIQHCGAYLYQVKGLFCLYDPLFFIRLFFLIRKINPHAIHSSLWSANVSSSLVAFFLRIPHISVYHQDTFDDNIFRKVVDKLTRNYSHCLVAVSNHVANSIISPATSKRVRIIPNGVDFNFLHLTASKDRKTKQDLGLDHYHFVIGFVGRLHAQKNVSLLLESFSLVSDKSEHARLVIVGVGQLESELRELADYLGITDKVIFVIGQNALHYYSTFDCFVQPSEKEGLSIALLEAMSFGLPSIVTMQGTKHPVVVDKYNGYMVRHTSKESLALTILNVMKDISMGLRIGINARNTVWQSFSSITMVNAYKKLFLFFAKER